MGNSDNKGLVFLLIAGLILLAVVTMERFINYLRLRKMDPLHDPHLYGFKLSSILVMCGVMLFSISWLFLDSVSSIKRLRCIEAKLDAVLRHMEARNVSTQA